MTEQPKEPMHDQLRRALPDQPELALALSESINEALTLGSTLTDVGARQDEMGQYVFDTPKVIFYDVGGDWEIDIITVEGFVGFDVPIGEVRITRRNDEAKAALRSYRISRGWYMIAALLNLFTREELHYLIDNLDKQPPQEWFRTDEKPREWSLPDEEPQF